MGKAPCAVCKTNRSNADMLPARNQCIDGWTKEYHGYLVGGYYGHKSATQLVCLDADPEILSGGNHAANSKRKLFSFVESRCGSLHCPLCLNGRELTGVVCSRRSFLLVNNSLNIDIPYSYVQQHL